MCLDKLIKYICTNFCGKGEEIPLPHDLVDINHTEVFTLLRAEFGDKCAIYLSDNEYKTTSIDELKNFLSSDFTDRYKYIRETFDCENFSYHLMGDLSIPGWAVLPFGIIWIGLDHSGHALNCFIDSDRKVWLIEPQSDAIISVAKYSKEHKFKAYLIVM